MRSSTCGAGRITTTAATATRAPSPVHPSTNLPSTGPRRTRTPPSSEQHPLRLSIPAAGPLTLTHLLSIHAMTVTDAPLLTEEHIRELRGLLNLLSEMGFAKYS